MALQFFSKGGKISEALEGLGEAARQRKESTQEIFEDAAKRGKKEFKKVVKAAKAADKEVHSNPWVYVGCAAAAALLVGFALGRAGRKETWER